MSKITFRLYSQAEDDVHQIRCLQLSSIGAVTGNWSNVDKYLTFTVAKSDVFGDFDIWVPNCSGYVTIETGQSINNYSVCWATQCGDGGRVTFHCNCSLA